MEEAKQEHEALELCHTSQYGCSHWGKSSADRLPCHSLPQGGDVESVPQCREGLVVGRTKLS